MINTMARNLETNISNGILLALSGKDCLAWKQTVGSFRAIDNPQRIVQVGTPGMSDIMTVRALTITPDMVGKTVGIAVAHEVKTASGTQRKGQQLWERALNKAGGIYLISRSPEQALEQVASLPDLILSR